MKVLLPTSVPLAPELPAGVEVVYYAVDQPLPAGTEDASLLVVWGNPQAQLEECARRLHSLRMVQTLAAGPDAVLAAGFAQDVVLTSGRSLHDGPVAEHTLALLLAAARRLHVLTRAQIGHRWASEVGGLQPIDTAGSFTTLRGARILIWGFGSIAATLAPHLIALGARVTGVAHAAGERANCPIVAERDLPLHLPQTDVLVTLLPATTANRHACNAERLTLLPPHAWVINVGRGATVDTAALLAALHQGRLAGAALDVFETEPLPADSPLWDRPDVIITPHAAGGRPLEADALIEHNVRALKAGTAPRNVVAR